LEASGSRKLAPQIDELEISLFGPGIGECIVVHLGNRQWMVVDSCMNVGRTEPIAVNYLNQMGVDVESDVKLVVVTQWCSVCHSTQPFVTNDYGCLCEVSRTDAQSC